MFSLDLNINIWQVVIYVCFRVNTIFCKPFLLIVKAQIYPHPEDVIQPGNKTTGWPRSGWSETTGKWDNRLSQIQRKWDNRLSQIRRIWDNREMRQPVIPDPGFWYNQDLGQPGNETTGYPRSGGSDTTGICDNREMRQPVIPDPGVLIQPGSGITG